MPQQLNLGKHRAKKQSVELFGQDFQSLQVPEMKVMVLTAALEDSEQELLALIMKSWHDADAIKPPSGKRVLVRVMYGTSGKPWTTVAAYNAKHTEKVDPDSFDGNLDYDEETDEYYYKEGWYEANLYTEVNYMITDTVLVWAYLPDDGIVIDEQAKVNAEKALKWIPINVKDLPTGEVLAASFTRPSGSYERKIMGFMAFKGGKVICESDHDVLYDVTHYIDIHEFNL